VRHRPVSDGKIYVEASVAVGEPGGCTPDTRAVEQARRVDYWPAHLCVLAAILLQVGLSARLTVGPRWLLPGLEGVLLIGLEATSPRGRIDKDHPVRRRLAIGMNAANAISLYLLAHELLNKHISNGRALILSGIAIWLTNVLIFRTVVLADRPRWPGQPGQTPRLAHARGPAGLRLLTAGQWSAVHAR
jgi:hypothetical protein